MHSLLNPWFYCICSIISDLGALIVPKKGLGRQSQVFSREMLKLLVQKGKHLGRPEFFHQHWDFCLGDSSTLGSLRMP
jgi:hypothetical protein